MFENATNRWIALWLCAHGVVFASVFYCLELPWERGTIQNACETLPCARSLYVLSLVSAYKFVLI